MTSKCGENKQVAHEPLDECVTDVLTILTSSVIDDRTGTCQHEIYLFYIIKKQKYGYLWPVSTSADGAHFFFQENWPFIILFGLHKYYAKCRQKAWIFVVNVFISNFLWRRIRCLCRTWICIYRQRAIDKSVSITHISFAMASVHSNFKATFRCGGFKTSSEVRFLQQRLRAHHICFSDWPAWKIKETVVDIKMQGPLGSIEKMKTSYATSVTTEFFYNSIVQWW